MRLEVTGNAVVVGSELEPGSRHEAALAGG
jgi:hypothetical protein